MLTGITLENFKAFKEPQFIPIKPITLVFGPNSAGKSSIVHALAFLEHAGNGDCDPGVVEYGWDKIHLGSWQNLVHGHDNTATMRISLHYENGGIMWSFCKTSNKPRAGEVFIFDRGSDSPYDPNQAVAKGINIIDGGIEWDFYLNNRHPYLDRLREELFILIVDQTRIPEKDLRPIYDKHFNIWNHKDWHEIAKFAKSNVGEEYFCLFPISDYYDKYTKDISTISKTRHKKEAFKNIQIGEALKNTLNNLINNNGHSDELIQFFSSLLKNSTHPASEFITPPSTKIVPENLVNEMMKKGRRSNHYGGLDGIVSPVHIGAYRIPPKERITRRSLATATGMEAWKKLLNDDIQGRSYRSPSKFVNKSLARLGLEYRISYRTIEYIAYKPEYGTEDRETSIEDRYLDRELVFVDRRGSPHPISSLGSGVGVVSPILVALAGAENELVTIEEPECHLHPKLQSELGDILIDRSRLSSQDGPNIYVETHSEHLILRILRRIRETTLDKLPDDVPRIVPSDIAVLYVQSGVNGSEVIELPVDANGEFTCDWPGGFFEERMKEFF